jgi:hypothetical protein
MVKHALRNIQLSQFCQQFFSVVSMAFENIRHLELKYTKGTFNYFTSSEYPSVEADSVWVKIFTTEWSEQIIKQWVCFVCSKNVWHADTGR